MSDADSADFVTIAEAARRLGISERQAHRLAGRLSDDDRHKSDKGPTRVRLDALFEMRPGDTASDTGQTDGRQDVRHEADAFVEHLKGEVEYLREAMRNQQVLHLEGLRSANRRIAELEAENAKLVGMLPAPPETDAMSDIGQTDVRQAADTGAYANTTEWEPDRESQAHEGAQHARTEEGREFVTDSGQDEQGGGGDAWPHLKVDSDGIITDVTKPNDAPETPSGRAGDTQDAYRQYSAPLAKRDRQAEAEAVEEALRQAQSERPGLLGRFAAWWRQGWDK